MLTHVKELIAQNAEKMRQHWPNCPLGIYSAGLGRKDLGEPITFAGIQSVRSKAKQIGHVDLVIIDEAHLVSHKDEGGYRTLLADLKVINPNLRIIGLTASPYRLGHGYITDKPAIFDALINPTSIEELIYKGYLSTLRSKLTVTKLEVDGVHKRGGEYIEAELQAAVDTKDKNAKVVREIIKLGAERKSWLIFCAGVAHAQHIAEALVAQGIIAECVTGETPSNERDRMLTEFKAGTIRALTNANVLTTGFDAPSIDLIAMLRPTMSPGLYVQMAGRGLRIADGKTDCLVLDFAGVVEQHGPITAVRPPPKKGDKVGEAPVKVCDHCQEICALSVRICPACGAEFPEPVKPALKLSNLDIMGQDGTDLEVSSWTWRKHISRASGKEMLALSYYGGLSDPPVTEYLAVCHDGYAGEKSRRLLSEIAYNAGWRHNRNSRPSDLHEMAQQLTESEPPSHIEFKRDGKFYTVLKRTWTT
jgi:DNA repair protein RadD